ncbi:MAG: ABC transporter substrate-binding protein, partial [Methanoculleus chikugoensis]|nr:ABC transporter substrate-binding protein [Methanoculleus chikugoensis]
MKKDARHLVPAIVAVCAVIALAFILAAPGTAGEDSAVTVRNITDMDGRTVTIPSEVRTVVITCCGGASQELAALGVGDRVVAQPQLCNMERLSPYGIVPGYPTTPDVGSGDNVNVEEILKLNPDVVIVSYYTETGNARIEAAGVPVVRLITARAGIETLKQEFRMLGTVFGREERAERLVAYWDETLARIETKLADLPEGERKRVYCTDLAPLSTWGRGGWGDAMIRAAGGINVAGEVDMVWGVDVSPEQLVRWDPEVIYGTAITSNMKDYSNPAGAFANPQFATVTAVRDGAVYPCPVGTFWWDRPAPESPLGILWLAQKLYPDRFADVDLADETKKFFREFYDYD